MSRNGEPCVNHGPWMRRLRTADDAGRRRNSARDTVHGHDRSGAIRESRRRSPHGTACAGVARTHRGPPATMPALPKRHRRERAKAWPGLVGVHTVRPGHRGRRPPARDRTGAHSAMPGMPDRHRTPASGRPDLRRRLPKRALAAVAQPAPSGDLTRGGPRWPNPPRSAAIRPGHAGPPTRTCSMHPRTWSPRSWRERSTLTRGRRRRTR